MECSLCPSFEGQKVSKEVLECGLCPSFEGVKFWNTACGQVLRGEKLVKRVIFMCCPNHFFTCDSHHTLNLCCDSHRTSTPVL